MNTLLLFISRISIVLYALAGAGIFFAIRGLVQAEPHRRIAMFGLEREAAQARFRRSLSVMLTLALLAGVVYVVDNVVVPNLTVAEEEPEEEMALALTTPEATPTGALLLYPTITPVNYYRVAFNQVFDAGYKLLPDISYDDVDPTDAVDMRVFPETAPECRR